MNFEQVLIDPHKRALYDLYGNGFNGSEAEGFSGTFGGMGEKGGHNGYGGTIFHQCLYVHDVWASFRSGDENTCSWNIPWKAAAIERTLPCSLEDLYIGTKKKVKILRDVVDATG